MTRAEDQATVIVRGLTKAYGDQQVLRGVDLTVERGAITALLGSNGAGKTTLISVLTTLRRADAGSATIDGHEVGSDPAAVRAAIGLTGQFAAVDDVLTGRENLRLVARLRRVEDPDGVADRLLARFDMTDAADRRAATYSGGMRRRIDLAMSLIGDPAVIVLDEPTTGLDPQARHEVWEAVRELARGGTTVLVTTQYLEEAEALADRVAILHAGRIAAEGTMEDLRRLLPPATVEYVERRPSLEEVFHAVVSAQQTERDDDRRSA